MFQRRINITNSPGAMHVPPVITMPSASATKSWFRSKSTPGSSMSAKYWGNDSDCMLETQVAVQRLISCTDVMVCICGGQSLV